MPQVSPAFHVRNMACAWEMSAADGDPLGREGRGLVPSSSHILGRVSFPTSSVTGAYGTEHAKVDLVSNYIPG